uniref:Uncharacterized protein n=1 Tax=Anguilla anguilla TaxID=7936 RepID=A0A0E9X7P5_ANGAN
MCLKCVQVLPSFPERCKNHCFVS